MSFMANPAGTFKAIGSQFPAPIAAAATQALTSDTSQAKPAAMPVIPKAPALPKIGVQQETLGT